jgi:hypothetical protein
MFIVCWSWFCTICSCGGMLFPKLLVKLLNMVFIWFMLLCIIPPFALLALPLIDCAPTVDPLLLWPLVPLPTEPASDRAAEPARALRGDWERPLPTA